MGTVAEVRERWPGIRLVKIRDRGAVHRLDTTPLRLLNPFTVCGWPATYGSAIEDDDTACRRCFPAPAGAP